MGEWKIIMRYSQPQYYGKYHAANTMQKTMHGAVAGAIRGVVAGGSRGTSPQLFSKQRFSKPIVAFQLPSFSDTMI